MAGVAGETAFLALSAPVAVRSLDTSHGFPDIKLPSARSGAPYRGLAVLLRSGDEPIGWLGVEVPATGEVTGKLLERAHLDQLAPLMGEAQRGSEPPGRVESTEPPEPPAFISHVVTTCNQAASVVRCVQSIIASEEGPFEVIVAENRPAHSTVRDALRSAFPGDERIRSLDAPIPGLSRARNAGLRAACGEIVAFTDDDIVVDPLWSGSLRKAFARLPDTSCVTGPILPAELETSAQVLMERFATAGNGFVRRVYSLDRPPESQEQPLLPYGAGHFGSGGNAAFRRDALLALDGFDPALGTGTAARGGEDLDVFIRLLLAGQTLLYEPSAIVWHPHPDTMELLSREVFDRGVGLGAMLAKQLVVGPSRFRLMQNIPRGLRQLVSAGSRRNAIEGPRYPSHLDRLERMGLAMGPAAYARSRWTERRLGVAHDHLERHGAGSIDGPRARRVWSGEFDVGDPDVSSGSLLASDGAAFDEARLLVRVLGEPAGFMTVPLTDGRLDPELVWQGIEQDLAETVNEHLRIAGAPALAKLRRGASCAGVGRPAWTSSARDTPVTVIVGTRDRSRDLERCLESLQGVEHDNLEILVVDNAPVDDSTARLVKRMASGDPRLRYVCEDRPGLSHARNRGAHEARGEILAFADDDVRVDPLWVAGLLRGFDRRQDVGCVTGIVASASLERAVEQYFDARVSWSRCEHRLFAADRGPHDSWLHPYAAGAFGTGANVAFRATVLREIGGFDECLGPGTPVAAAEDLDVFVRVLLSGYRLSYEPGALVWHAHRGSEGDLDKQMYAYGKGLAAYLCKYAVSRRTGPDVAARSLFGVWHFTVLMRRSRMAAKQTIVGHHVLGPELLGLLVGPWAYLRSRQIRGRESRWMVAP